MDALDPKLEGRFVVGGNYWPADRGFFWWEAFSKGRVSEDFSRIRETGWEVVRVLLSWETFQPKANQVSTWALDRLVEVADLAEKQSLRLLPSLLACCAGGVNWAPPWLLLAREEDGRWPVFSSGKLRRNVARSLYGDPEVLEAQVRYLREVSNAVGGHPALWAWDLASAPSRLVAPSDSEALRLWLRVMTEELRSRKEDIPITLTLCPEDLWEPGGHWRQGVAGFLDFVSLHAVRGSFPFETGHLDSACPAFLGLFAQWLCGGNPVLIAACGVPTRPAGMALEKIDPEGFLGLVSEEEAALYLEQVLDRCWEARLQGVLAWCYADCVPFLWELAPFDIRPEERFCGVFRSDGTGKASQSLFERFLGRQRKSQPAASPLSWIDLSPQEYAQDPAGHAARLYRRYRERLEETG